MERLIAELFEAAGPDRATGEVLYARIVTLDAWRGDVDSARHTLERLAPLRTSGSVDDEMSVVALDAVVAVAAGDHAAALAAGSRVVGQRAQRIGLRHESLRMAWVAAVEAAIELGDLHAANELVTAIDGQPAGLVPPYLRQMAVHYRARLAAATGDQVEADRLFGLANDGLAALGYPYWLARARLDRAEWLVSIDRHSEAAEFAGRALATFDELAAPVWSDRARRLAGIDLPGEVSLDAGASVLNQA